VLGGGYIALEFSGIFQRFGSEVHNVFRQPLPLRGFDEEVSSAGLLLSLGSASLGLNSLQAAWLLVGTFRAASDGSCPCRMLTHLAHTHTHTHTHVQVRKFAFEQYAAAGLTMHPGYSPVEVRKQDNGLLTCVVADKDGNKMEIADNDQVRVCLWTSGSEVGGLLRRAASGAGATLGRELQSSARWWAQSRTGSASLRPPALVASQLTSFEAHR
jgi:hypothetical protein